jgi:hypothetical protein
MYITADAIIKCASLMTALGVLGGLVVAFYRFYARQRAQDRELSAIRGELTLLCYSVRACLQGLAEQGCDGPVHDAIERMDKHLNKAAHKGEET